MKNAILGLLFLLSSSVLYAEIKTDNANAVQNQEQHNSNVQEKKTGWLYDKDGKAIAYQTPDPKSYYTYEELYTLEGFKKSGRTGTYRKDPHVWVYTSAFAKRFGMPKEWIDDSLKGAEALAYRYEDAPGGVRCGYYSDLETCSRSIAYILDMYISEDANIPWNTEARYGSMYGHGSIGFLMGSVDQKPEYMGKRYTKYPFNPGSFYMGVDRVEVYSNSNSSRRDPLPELSIYEFDRDIYPGLDLISGNLSLSFPEKRDISLEFQKFIFKNNGRSLDFTAMKDPSNIYHKIFIPNSFMQRIEKHHKEYFKKLKKEKEILEKYKE